MHQAQLQSAQYYAHPAVTRYFDHVQNRPSVRAAAASLAPAFDLVSFDLENAPKLERKADPPKEKKAKVPKDGQPSSSAAPAEAVEKKEKKAKKGAAEPAGEAAAAAAPAEGKTQKKEKKEKKPAEEGKKGGNAPKAEDAGEPVPSMVDLRVGHIVDSAYSIASALRIALTVHCSQEAPRRRWSLRGGMKVCIERYCCILIYLQQIDFGEETGPRTVVSGLVNYIPIEQMQDKYLVGVVSLGLFPGVRARSDHDFSAT